MMSIVFDEVVTTLNGVLDGNADVVVCDGFAGNVLLKSIEGTAKVVFDDIRRAAADASDTQKAQLEALIGILKGAQSSFRRFRS